MAPKPRRGRFVSTYQLAITMGILIADIVDAVAADNRRWRLMLGIAIIPGVAADPRRHVRMTDTPRW